MKVTQADYVRRFKLADYEHEEYHLQAIIEGGEKGAEVLLELKAEVNKAFTGEVEAPEAEETKAPKAKKEKKEKKNAKSKTARADDEDENAEDSEGEDGGADDESDQDDEGANASSDDDGDDSSEESEESEDGEDGEESEDEEAKPAKGSKAAKGKKGFVKKPQPYDRKIEAHKEIFGRVLRSVAPDWKKSEATKAKAKKLSATLEGSKFLDETGEVVDSFKKTLKTLWASKQK